MPNTTIDRRLEKQLSIEQKRTQMAARYPAIWEKIVSEWLSPGDDRAWLTYSANYLFRTGDVRWALDPLELHWRIPEAPSVDVARTLSRLSFVLLSHRHADHLDLELIRQLSKFPILWVIPAFLQEEVIQQCGIPKTQVITPSLRLHLEINGIRITSFEGLHWESPPPGSSLSPHGVPAVTYLVSFNRKRWLFPGDIRFYNSSLVPDFDTLDGVFAHIWLGRRSALCDDPPLLDAFCRFFGSLPVNRILITHLEELGRDAEDYWEARHYSLIANRLQQHSPDKSIFAAYLGESTPL